MLQKLAQAAEWEERARQTTNESQRQGCLRLAKGYSHLAKSYTFVESLESFLLDLHKKGLPSKVQDLPKPPSRE
jgi:hypothetical protein